MRRFHTKNTKEEKKKRILWLYAVTGQPEGRCGRAGGGRKHLEFPAGGDQGVKFKFGLE
jgi:hypothetical protein